MWTGGWDGPIQNFLLHPMENVLEEARDESEPLLNQDRTRLAGVWLRAQGCILPFLVARIE